MDTNTASITILLQNKKLSPAGYWIHLLARIIDIAIFFIGYCILIYLFTMEGYKNAMQVSMYSWVILGVLYSLIYYPILENKGGTIGKLIVGIRSVSVDFSNPGEYLTISQAYKKSMYLNWPLIVQVFAFLYVLKLVDEATP